MLQMYYLLLLFHFHLNINSRVYGQSYCENAASIAYRYFTSQRYILKILIKIQINTHRNINL